MSESRRGAPQNLRGRHDDPDEGGAGTRNIVKAVRHVCHVMGDIRALRNMDDNKASTYYSDPDVLAEISCGLGEAMTEMNLNDEKVVQFAFRSD
ncbi:hypothetical protein FF2_028957 [Malus domestica]